mgnify:CR=1 FL=1
MKNSADAFIFHTALCAAGVTKSLFIAEPNKIWLAIPPALKCLRNVGYYKKNEMIEGDNPPVGILLCTDKGSQMVEYALSGMDNQLFVSTYMLHLPDKKKLEEFMLKEIEEMEM